MKRLLLLIFLFVVAFLSLARLVVPKKTGPHLLALVPRESFCVLELHAPKHNLSALARTPLGRRLINLDWPYLLASMSDKSKQAADFHRLARLTSLVTTVMAAPRSPLLDTGVVALIPPETGQDTPEPVAGTLLLLGRLHSTNSFWRLSSCLEKAAHLQLEKKEIFNGHPVFRYQMPDAGPFYVGQYLDVVIVSPVREAVTQAISLARAGVGANNFSLFGDDFFIRTRGKQTKNLLLTAYVNAWALERLSPPVRQREYPLSLLSGLTGQGLDKILFTWRKEGKIETISSHCRFRRKDLPALARLCSLRQPVLNPELSAVPAGITAYFWSNWFSPASWWQIYLGRVGRGYKKYQKIADSVLEKYLSLSMSELTSLFEYEWSVFVTDIKQSAFLPVPRLCLRLGIIDPGRLASLMEKNIAALPHRLDIVADTKVISLIMAGGLMEPSYSFIDHNLWLFDGYDLVEKFLRPGAARLVDDSAFRGVVENPKNITANLQLFVRVQPVIQSLLEFYSSLGTVSSAHPATTQSRRYKRVLERLVLPLAKNLAGMESLFVSASVHGNEFESRLRLRQSPNAAKGEEENE